MVKEYEYTYEVCPECGEEVQLRAELKVQTCPNCGKRIVACSMCEACYEPESYCHRCCLSFQCDRENERLAAQDEIREHTCIGLPTQDFH